MFNRSVKLFYCLAYKLNAVNTINIRTLARTTGLIRQFQCHNKCREELYSIRLVRIKMESFLQVSLKDASSHFSLPLTMT